MNRRSFLDLFGKGSVAVAAAALAVTSKAAGQNAAETTTSTLQGNGTTLRLPRDLAKIAGSEQNTSRPADLTVACYTFPNYHPSAIHNKLYGPGWTEYNLTRYARPWFPGHQQPRGPLLGELDESQPATWEKYNQLAKQHGIDVLIWDWYWYNGEPALHEALENGFLQSSNHHDIKFACMWTNHPWYILYPTLQTDGTPKYPASYPPPDKDLETCWRSLSYILARYCHYPNYWKIDGKPVICIWDPNNMEKSLGLPTSKKVLSDLQAYAKKLGYPGIHFHSTGYYSPNSRELGITTAGSYNPLDWAADRFQPKENELADYEVAVADVATRIWPEEHNRMSVPYIPAVAPGWDSTPRYIQKNPRPESPNRDIWPACTIFKNESPAAFKAFVQAALVYLHQHPDVPPILTIACFNEWSEGHYLLPDNRFGYGMLDALAEALGIEDSALLHGKA